MSSELIARQRAAREQWALLSRMLELTGWVLVQCVEFQLTTYPAAGGQQITLVAPSWERLHEVLFETIPAVRERWEAQG